MGWSDNEKISIKQAAKQAKKRLLESTTRGTVGKSGGGVLSAADVKFYKKVLGIVNSSETIENPIAILAGDALKKCGNQNERMKLVFETARKFNEAKEYIEKHGVTTENFDEIVTAREKNKNINAQCKLLNNALYNSQVLTKNNQKTEIVKADEDIAALAAADDGGECTGRIGRKCLTCTEDCATKNFIYELRDKGYKISDVIEMYGQSETIHNNYKPTDECVAIGGDKCLAEYDKRKMSDIFKEYDMNVENNEHAEKLICERAGDLLYTGEGEKALAADWHAIERSDDQSDEVLKLMVKLIQKNYDKLNKQTL